MNCFPLFYLPVHVGVLGVRLRFLKRSIGYCLSIGLPLDWIIGFRSYSCDWDIEISIGSLDLGLGKEILWNKKLLVLEIGLRKLL